jgi:acetolactate decarboxylase
VHEEAGNHGSRQIDSTLVGFPTPAFLASLHVPGLHLQFLSADFQHGGHLLSCEPRQVQAGVQIPHRVELALPISLDYLTWGFRWDMDQERRLSPF